jgi:hypothetical protein
MNMIPAIEVLQTALKTIGVLFNAKNNANIVDGKTDYKSL